MIGIEIRFLSGRFHGTGWHQAHNEGVPEWPPSPWRVLRALVSSAYAQDLPAAEVEPLFEKLRGLPRYQLPPAVDAHCRHYMPDTDDAYHKKAKVFDAFVAVAGGARNPQPLTVAWTADLTGAERMLLDGLCRRVAYLGRAESWAELKAVDVDHDRWSCWPDEQTQGMAATTLLALAPADELASWSATQPVRKKGRDIPRTLWDVLTFDGERFRKEGWSGVPGTQLSRYVFADRPFRRSVVPSASARRSRPPATVARFAIRSAVLPRLHEALSLGERLRKSAMSQSRKISGDARPVFSGHDAALSNHQHAMYLSSSEDPRNTARGLVDHLVVAARGGFDEKDVLALQRLRRLWSKDGHDLELILVGLGQFEDFGGLRQPQTALLARSRIWQSLTPFVPTRHPKRVRGVEVDAIEDQLRRGCRQLLGVEPEAVSPVGERVGWAQFRRLRKKGGGRRGPDVAVGARLVFAEPVVGPIALGYGAHFGLGVFTAQGE